MNNGRYNGQRGGNRADYTQILAQVPIFSGLTDAELSYLVRAGKAAALRAGRNDFRRRRAVRRTVRDRARARSRLQDLGRRPGTGPHHRRARQFGSGDPGIRRRRLSRFGRRRGRCHVAVYRQAGFPGAVPGPSRRWRSRCFAWWARACGGWWESSKNSRSPRCATGWCHFWSGWRGGKAGRRPKALEFSLPASHQELAAQIGTVRELVSRNLSRLQAEGLVKVEGRTVVVRDLKLLEAELEAGE